MNDDIASAISADLVDALKCIDAGWVRAMVWSREDADKVTGVRVHPSIRLGVLLLDIRDIGGRVLTAVVTPEVFAAMFADSDYIQGHIAEETAELRAERDAAYQRGLAAAAEAIQGSVRYGAEMNHDGTEDPGMAAFVEGVSRALDAVRALSAGDAEGGGQ